MNVRIGAPLIVDGPVYANGPVYVRGVDIKTELEKLNDQLTQLDQQSEARINRAIYFAIKNFRLKEDEKSSLENAINGAIKITDWGSRIDFWAKFFGTINPFLSFTIQQLILYGNF